jgi:hypothetical protein
VHLNKEGQELKQGKYKMGFYWKVAVRCLKKVVLGHPLDLIRHQLHLSEIANMLNHRVRIDEIKLSVLKLSHIPSITYNSGHIGM